MKAAAIGALVFSFIVGGIGTLLGFPRGIPAPTFKTANSISAKDPTRPARPFTTLTPDNYF